MIDQPESRAITAGIPYWIFAFFVLPFFGNFFSADYEHAFWVDFAYHLINFIVVLIIFIPYLRESFFTVQIYLKKFLTIVGWCIVAVLALKVSFFNWTFSSGNEILHNAAFASWITTESDLRYFSTAFISAQPLWGILCVVLFTPVTTVCLLYACIFAPISNTRPVLAYVVMVIAFLLVRLVMTFAFWSFEEEMAIFLVQLPIHLVACWAYQQTDTVWAPITIHTVSNILLTPLAMHHMGFF